MSAENPLLERIEFPQCVHALKPNELRPQAEFIEAAKQAVMMELSDLAGPVPTAGGELVIKVWLDELVRSVNGKGQTIAAIRWAVYELAREGIWHAVELRERRNPKTGKQGPARRLIAKRDAVDGWFRNRERRDSQRPLKDLAEAAGPSQESALAEHLGRFAFSYVEVAAPQTFGEPQGLRRAREAKFLRLWEKSRAGEGLDWEAQGRRRPASMEDWRTLIGKSEAFADLPNLPALKDFPGAFDARDVRAALPRKIAPITPAMVGARILDYMRSRAGEDAGKPGPPPGNAGGEENADPKALAFAHLTLCLSEGKRRPTRDEMGKFFGVSGRTFVRRLEKDSEYKALAQIWGGYDSIAHRQSTPSPGVDCFRERG